MPSGRQWLHGSARYPSNLRWLPQELSSIFDSGAIPTRFFYYFTTDDVIEEIQGVSGRRLARFGFTLSKDYVAVDLDTHEVIHVPTGSSRVAGLINSGLDVFSQFMASCEEHYPYYKEGAGFDLAIAASGELRLGLEPIDPGAFAPGSYWSDFLSDVSNGDYGEPVDDEEDEEDW